MKKLKKLKIVNLKKGIGIMKKLFKQYEDTGNEFYYI